MSRTINAKDGYEYDEIPIEDVQPGDVARCNGREFPVLKWRGGWYIWRAGIQSISAHTAKELGFTFHRKVKREPRTFDGKINCVEFDGQIKVVPDSRLVIPWAPGTRVRITELLDGEDGA